MVIYLFSVAVKKSFVFSITVSTAPFIQMRKYLRGVHTLVALLTVHSLFCERATFVFFSFNCFFTIDKSNKENILSSLGDVCSQNFIVTMFIVVPTSHDIQVRRRGHVLCVLCFFLLTTSEVNGTKWKCMCSCTKGPCWDKGRYQTYRLSDVYVRTAQLKNFNVVYTALK